MADYNSIRKTVEEQSLEDLNKKINTHNTVYDTATKNLKESYDYAIDDVEKSYEDDYRENAVQKKVNEFYIKEEMANMGLTDSGLSRSQITANQLSYSNKKNEIDRQRQSMVDSLTREMTNKISEIETSRLQDEQAIRDAHVQQIDKTAASIYNSELEAETAATKANYDYLTELAKIDNKNNQKNSYVIKANNSLLSHDYSGTLRDNGVDTYRITKNYEDYVRYVDKNSGKSVELKVGVNPYTGDDNTDIERKSDTAKAYAKYSAFENGYQPKGVFFNGKDYGWVSDSGLRDEIYGNTQRVHQTKDGSLWIWDGRRNKYIQYIQ